MSPRIETEQRKDPFIIPREEYNVDKARGYTVVVAFPAQTIIIRNPRNPGHEIKREVPPVLKYCCMKCKFDIVEGDYAPEKPEGERRTALEVMKLHIYRGNHPWCYRPYENPYGNVDDVIIEGVDDYTKEISS